MTGLLVVVLAGLAVWAVRKYVWPHTPPGRWRDEYGDDGWAQAGELRRHLNASEPSVKLGTTAVGPAVPRAVKVDVEQTVGTFGGPRRGKTLGMAARVRAHHGPAFVSSTRLDLIKSTMGARQQKGPVHLFLPEQTGGLESTVFFPIERGCGDATFAAETAASMVGATDAGSADDQTWLQSATSVLAGFLMAADLAEGGSMMDVYRWTTDWLNPEPLQILVDHGEVAVAAGVAMVVQNPAKNTAGSVMRAVELAAQFMKSPQVARMCCPRPGDPVLDVRDLIETGGTLYAVTTQRAFSPLEPLAAVLASRLFDTARKVAAERGGALDPVFLLALDEIKITARVPLHDWAAVAAGDGILLDWSAQSPAQLRERWGEHATDSIIDCTTSLLVFGGLKGSDLQRFADLCGERREDIEGDEDGRQEWRPVLTGARLARLRKFRAVLYSGECRPTIVKTPRWSVTVPIVWEKVRPPRREGVVVQRQVETRQRQAIPMPGPVQPHALPPVTVHAEREESAA